MSHNKMERDVRKSQILDAALFCLKREGLENLRRQHVATEAGVATGSVSFHFGDMEQLREAMLDYAMESRDAEALSHFISTADYRGRMEPRHIRIACTYLKAG